MPHPRFIPACAGNTPSWTGSKGTSTVHPRVRGEHARHRCRVSTATGSSPRARGTHSSVAVGAYGHRFIPACAGNTGPLRVARSMTPVHPRVRGEHESAVPADARGCGSSPRARGTPQPPGPRLSVSAVHPRVRGEHPARFTRPGSWSGSSPRARGTLRYPVADAKRRRFIPACAGNTMKARGTPTCTPVHPRVRGEHVSRSIVIVAIAGSSPRARGTRA